MADASWQKSVHVNTKSGVVVHCVDCHLPPHENNEVEYLWEKSKAGIKDLWGFYTKDSASFDWEKRKQLAYAEKMVFNESCVACHKNLYPRGLSSEGALAHLYYEENAEKLNLQCIGCHLNVGHFDPNYKHESNMQLGAIEDTSSQIIHTEATIISSFANFTEKIPSTPVSFNMIAIPGGSFMMGSADNEAYRNIDESPLREVDLNPYYIGEAEVSWDEFLAFFNKTRSEGRIDPAVIMARNAGDDIDAVSGPTPPYGNPDQGWGYGKQPAITMTHYAAQMYCKWLSITTGKKYRLPTEAEWEYASRGGKEGPYFFEGETKKFTSDRFFNKIFGVDTTTINSYVVYALNSKDRTQTASASQANPFGLINSLGNVMEYCADWYAEDAYTQTPSKVSNPKGPSEGSEYVVRGGSFASDAKELRCASRDYTRSTEWLKTDPQSPKSIWWLSDCNRIGFRVVCEMPDAQK
ncbi:hypothetical protein AwDysgo_01650 [Bacteroidales bacterium]|nr:hypothetical protein AwDysgo_01650 [Bacteroidales bacterium]